MHLLIQDHCNDLVCEKYNTHNTQAKMNAMQCIHVCIVWMNECAAYKWYHQLLSQWTCTVRHLFIQDEKENSQMCRIQINNIEWFEFSRFYGISLKCQMKFSKLKLVNLMVKILKLIRVQHSIVIFSHFSQHICRLQLCSPQCDPSRYASYSIKFQLDCLIFHSNKSRDFKE